MVVSIEGVFMHEVLELQDQQAIPDVSMDRLVHGHPSIRPCPCPSVSVHGLLDNKHGRLAPKIGILAMLMSPVTLYYFLCL